MYSVRIQNYLEISKKKTFSPLVASSVLLKPVAKNPHEPRQKNTTVYFTWNHSFTCCFPLIQLNFYFVAVSDLRKLIFQVIAASSTLEQLWHLITFYCMFLFWMYCFLLSAIRNPAWSGFSTQGTGSVWILPDVLAVPSPPGLGAGWSRAGQRSCCVFQPGREVQVLPEIQWGVQG